jgi:hypothetical protein
VEEDVHVAMTCSTHIGVGVLLCSTSHPRESEEWKQMTMAERYAFFAPIWRVMRDDNMPVDEVARQVEYVALSVKKGSQVRSPGPHWLS